MAAKKKAPAKKKAKPSIDERLKLALAEAKRLQKARQTMDKEDDALAEMLSDLATDMRDYESKMDEDRVTSDDLDEAASSVNNYDGLPDYDSVICYLEGKHGC